MNKDEAEKKTARASKAKDLLADPVLTEALDALRSDYIRMWEKAPFKDNDLRESMWHAVNVIDGVRSHLRGYIEKGKLPDRQLKELKKKPPFIQFKGS